MIQGTFFFNLDNMCMYEFEARVLFDCSLKIYRLRKSEHMRDLCITNHKISLCGKALYPDLSSLFTLW